MARARSPIARLIPPAGVIRLLIVVGGGLVVLQSSQSLSPPKLLYLAAAGTAFLFSCRAVWNLRDRPMFEAGLPWLIVSVLLLGLIALSLPVAVVHGTPISEWLRDAATYGLVAAVPVIALDAAASMQSRLLLALTVATAALAALSHAFFWITARSLAVLPFEHLVLPTGSLPITLFLVSLGAALIDRPRRLAWIILGGVTLGAFLAAGSRSALFYLIAFPVMTIVAGRPVLPRSATASAGIGLVAVAFVVLVQAAFVSTAREPAPPIDVGPPVSSPGDSPGQSPGESPVAPSPTPRPPPNPDATLLARLQAFLASPERDGSVQERVAQYQAAWDLFVSSPVVGVGLGHPIVWTRLPDGPVWRAFTADTPLVLPAKLGILGVAWLAIFAFIWVRFVRRLRRAVGITIPGLALTGWVAILAALAWSGLSLEDKGFSFSLMFLLSLAFIEIERVVPPNEGQPSRRSATTASSWPS